MPYPAFPIASRVYPMLTSFDAGYMLAATRAMISRPDGPLECMIAMSIVGVTGQGWTNGMLQTLVAEGGGRLDVSPRYQFPQRIGPKFNFVVTSQGGVIGE